MVDGMADNLPSAALDSMEKAALLNASRHGGKADVGAVVSRVLGELPELRAKAGEVAAEARRVVQRVNAMGQEGQLSLLSSKYPDATRTKAVEGRVGLPPLPNAEKGKVTFRIPPEPSGFMHIGHAMAFSINSLYSQMYQGTLWLRFEDTNPRKVLPVYYESFRKGLDWLGIRYDHEKNVSEDNELIYDYGRRLLAEGKAYACSCDEAKVKKLRFDGAACEHRDQGPETNLRSWDQMLAKKLGEGSMVIRLKGDMASVNYALRDPNIFRIIGHEHPITGSRYTVWPTYYMANTVEDEVCGVTHVLRSSEFQTELQAAIRAALGFRHVEIIQFSRFNFKGTPVHKRLLRPLVENGLVSGWDDPRMPTVEGVKRRGILPEAIREFTLQVGYTKAEHEYDWSLLLAVNRKLLDPVSKRLFFVPDPVRIEVEGAPRRRVTIPFHPQNDLGSRSIETSSSFYISREDMLALEPGQIFRLMELFNVEPVTKGERPSVRYAGDALIEGSRKVQWTTPSHSAVELIVPGPLYDEDDRFNEGSLVVRRGFGEEAVGALKAGEIVQFPRVGFCRLDSTGSFVLAQ